MLIIIQAEVIIRDFIDKYKKMYNDKYKKYTDYKLKHKKEPPEDSEEFRYKDYSFGKGTETQYTNDKEACSLILLMALLEEGGTCAADFKRRCIF